MGRVIVKVKIAPNHLWLHDTSFMQVQPLLKAGWWICALLYIVNTSVGWLVETKGALQNLEPWTTQSDIVNSISREKKHDFPMVTTWKTLWRFILGIEKHYLQSSWDWRLRGEDVEIRLHAVHQFFPILQHLCTPLHHLCVSVGRKEFRVQHWGTKSI